MTTDPYVEFSENLQSAVAAALRNHAAPPVPIDAEVGSGDVRALWTSELANSELVYVVRLLENGLAIVVHVHADPDMAGSNDAVIPSSFSESGFTFVVRSPLHTTVPIRQLGRLVDRIDDQLVHNIETFLVGATPKPPLLQGSPVAGPRDPRWMFLDDTHERFVRVAVGAWATFLNEVITPQQLEEFSFDDRFEEIRVFMLDDDPQITPELVEAYLLLSGNQSGDQIDPAFFEKLEELVEHFVAGGFTGRGRYLFGIMDHIDSGREGDPVTELFARDLVERTDSFQLGSVQTWMSSFGNLPIDYGIEELHSLWVRTTDRARQFIRESASRP